MHACLMVYVVSIGSIIIMLLQVASEGWGITWTNYSRKGEGI